MNLSEVVARLSEFEDEQTIYAEEPWSDMSEAIVVAGSENGSSAPVNSKEKCLEYFLEVFMAKEFLEGWVMSQRQIPSIKEKVGRLIQYAINDA